MLGGGGNNILYALEILSQRIVSMDIWLNNTKQKQKMVFE